MENKQFEPQQETPPSALTLEKVREIYSRTYSDDGKPDFSHIYPYYHQNVRFRDSIQVIEGRNKFIEMCDRLARRCSEIYMTVHDIAQNGNIIFLQWTMTTRFRKAPLTPMHGVTKLTRDHQGLIVEHRDHFDLWGDTFDAIPVIGKMYRWVMRKLLG